MSLVARCATVLGKTCCRQMPGPPAPAKPCGKGPAHVDPLPMPCAAGARPSGPLLCHTWSCWPRLSKIGTRDTVSYCDGEVQSADCDVRASHLAPY